MYYTYLLKSKRNNQLHIGSTNNLKRRLIEHNAGTEISTRRYMPWEILYYEAYNAESFAGEREKRLKYNGNALREAKKRIGLPSKSGAGFTIIELLVAIFLISVGIIGTLTAIQQTAVYVETSSSRLTATYLAQEGLELVKNIRDMNWLRGYVWDEFLGDVGPCGNCGDWTVDFDNDRLYTGTERYLYIADEGPHRVYRYTPTFPATAILTPFRRTVTIFDKQDLDSDGSVDQMKVKVMVNWESKGFHEVSAEEILYNWRE